MVRIGSRIIFHLSNSDESQVLHTVWCSISGWGCRGNLMLITLGSERVNRAVWLPYGMTWLSKHIQPCRRSHSWILPEASQQVSLKARSRVSIGIESKDDGASWATRKKCVCILILCKFARFLKFFPFRWNSIAFIVFCYRKRTNVVISQNDVLETMAAVTLELKKWAKQTTAVTWKPNSYHVFFWAETRKEFEPR